MNVGSACPAVPADGEGSFDGMADDPAATAASNNPVLSTLATAVSEAELVDTLNGEGPFTIFAPTNDAFRGDPRGGPQRHPGRPGVAHLDPQLPRRGR